MNETFSSAIPSHARGFTTGYVGEWIPRQFDAWRFRKKWEPGGIEHPRAKDFDLLPAQDRIYLVWLTRGILDYLRFGGRKSILELKDAGRRLLAGKIDLQIGGLLEPIHGIPLKDGTMVVIRPELACRIAFAHHKLWMHCRERSWLLPYKELWQPKTRMDRAHQTWDRGNPDQRWDGDLRFVYGLAIEIAKLDKNDLLTLLNATASQATGMDPLAGVVSSEDMERWRSHYVSQSDNWRRPRAPGTMEAESASSFEDADIGTRVLNTELSLWVLDFLRIYGRDAIEQLREVGRRIALERSAPRVGNDFDPHQGVLLRDGSYAGPDPSLLRALAGDYWAHRALTAEWTRLLPFKRAHHKVPKPDPKRDGQRAYGILTAIATQRPKDHEWLLGSVR